MQHGHGRDSVCACVQGYVCVRMVEMAPRPHLQGRELALGPEGEAGSSVSGASRAALPPAG